MRFVSFYLSNIHMLRIVDVKKITLEKIIIKPTTVTPNSPLRKIREVLLKNRVKRVVITSRKKPLGIITEKDIAKKIYSLKSKSMSDVKASDFKQKKLFTLQKEDTVSQCAKIMKKHRISVVIITNEENELEGIVTKTDLASIFLTKSSKQYKVSEIMKKQVISATPSDPILHVEKLLLKYGISRVVIKRNHKPVGVITFRDFVPAKIPQWISKNADPREVQEYKWKKGLEEIHSNEISYLFPFQASDIMSENPITIEYDSEVKKAITLMIKHNISGLPVVKKSRLVGIITKSDIVKTLAS